MPGGHVHGNQDTIVPVAHSRAARDAYRSEGHEVEYVEVKGLGHSWAHGEKINERIWKFFESHPIR